MKKFKISLIFLTVIFCLVSTILCGCAKNTINKEEQAKIEIKEEDSPVEYKQFEDFFSPAFQLIWNDFSDKFVKGKVNFIAGNPKIADYLNERHLNESMISKNDLYKICDRQTFATKKEIEKNLKKKFNEKSKLLDGIEWYKKTDSHYVLYAMFKKDILFIKSFVDLYYSPFDNSKEEYKYFGVTKNTDRYSSVVSPIYYANENDYAVKLATKSGDEIILATTKSNEPVFKIWEDLYKNKISKSENLEFDKNAEIKIPEIKFNKNINYQEFLGEKIKGCDFIITTAFEDIEFSLDKNGAKIRNEAIMGIDRMALRPEFDKKRYYFDKPFIIFIRYKNADTPYFALKIKDTKYLVEYK